MVKGKRIAWAVVTCFICILSLLPAGAVPVSAEEYTAEDKTVGITVKNENVGNVSGTFKYEVNIDTFYSALRNGTSLHDIMRGTKGIDRLNGATGNDTLYGYEGDDTLYGGTGNDTLYGGDGEDQLYGNDGNDTLYGDSGDDIIDGGVGRDIFMFGINDGNDVIKVGPFDQDDLDYELEHPGHLLGRIQSKTISVSGADSDQIQFATDGEALIIFFTNGTGTITVMEDGVLSVDSLLDMTIKLSETDYTIRSLAPSTLPYIPTPARREMASGTSGVWTAVKNIKLDLDNNESWTYWLEPGSTYTITQKPKTDWTLKSVTGKAADAHINTSVPNANASSTIATSKHEVIFTNERNAIGSAKASVSKRLLQNSTTTPISEMSFTFEFEQLAEYNGVSYVSANECSAPIGNKTITINAQSDTLASDPYVGDLTGKKLYEGKIENVLEGWTAPATPGTYAYRVKEVHPAAPVEGVTYTKSEFIMLVEVGSNGEITPMPCILDKDSNGNTKEQYTTPPAVFDEKHELIFYNNYGTDGGTTPTGIITNNLPFIVIIAGGVGGAVAATVIKAKKRAKR